MSSKKTAVYLMAMIVLGIAAFALLGYVVEWREGRPVHTQAPERLSMLAEGAEASARRAKEHLMAEQRSSAVHALDAALRASDVGKHAASNPEPFRVAANHLRRARYAIQIGNPSRAIQPLQNAQDALAGVSSSSSGRVPPTEEWGEYEDAVLLDVNGVRIGELHKMRQNASGDAEAELIIGGAREVFGLFDVGGNRLRVPADSLYFGKLTWLGSVHVVLPRQYPGVTSGRR